MAAISAWMDIHDAAGRPCPLKRVLGLVIVSSPPYLYAAARCDSHRTALPTPERHDTRGAPSPQQGGACVPSACAAYLLAIADAPNRAGTQINDDVPHPSGGAAAGRAAAAARATAAATPTAAATRRARIAAAAATARL
jgi:hypothetical protein